MFGNVIDALIDVAAKEATTNAHILPLFLWISAFTINSGESWTSLKDISRRLKVE